MGFRLFKTRGMLRREAASWLARLQSGREPDTEREFQKWHDADSRQAAAFHRVQQSYEQAGLLRHSPAVGSRMHRSAPPKRELQLRPALAAALAVALFVPVAVVVYRDDGSPFTPAGAVMLMTQVGEIRHVKLADGSRITLDTATKVDVEIGRSRRSAHLRYGRARFQIVEEKAPFVIESGTTVITTRQSVIDVERAGGQGHIEVLAGAADVRGSQGAQKSTLSLAAGEALTVVSGKAGQKLEALPPPDWTKGMLQFDGTSLAQAVARANRYSERHIILTGDLEALKVSGAFRAGDTDGLAKALAAAFGLLLERRSDGSLILSRTAFPARSNKSGG